MRDFKIQYVTDSEGIKKAVLIPIEEWENTVRIHSSIGGKSPKEMTDYLALLVAA